MYSSQFQFEIGFYKGGTWVFIMRGGIGKQYTIKSVICRTQKLQTMALLLFCNSSGFYAQRQGLESIEADHTCHSLWDLLRSLQNTQSQTHEGFVLFGFTVWGFFNSEGKVHPTP